MKFSGVLLLLLLTRQQTTPSCNFDFQYLYYQKCVPIDCIDKLCDTLAAQTSFGPTTSGSTPSLLMVNNYSPRDGFQISLSWTDGQNGKFLLGDPINCVNYTIYQRSDLTQNSIRINTINDTTPDRVAPQWPKNVSYVQNQTSYTASIIIRFTPDDVKKYCSLRASSQYTCFFELAFRVSGKTQNSNIFGLQININGTTATTQLNINALVRAGPIGVQEVNVSSSLGAFEVLNTDGSVGKPLSNLNNAQSFYLEHLITDPSFKTWYIRNPSITFNSPQVAGKLNFTQSVTTPGRNVYKVQARLVENGITYTLTGTLSSSRRILQGSEEVKVTYTSIKLNDPAALNEAQTNTTVNTPVVATSTISTDKNFKKNNNPKTLKPKTVFYAKITLPSKYSKVQIEKIKLNYNGKNSGPPYGITNQKGASILTFKATSAMSKMKVNVSGTLSTKENFTTTFTFPTIK